jgi:2-hydroxychromene-2-carboxylate isomerase
VVSLLTAFQVNADQGVKAKDSNELIDAAKDTLQCMMAAQHVGRVTVEDIYRWSRRLMAAEIQAGKPNATADHLQRMDNLHKKTAALHNTGAAGAPTEALAATNFYFLEAQALNAK